MINIFQDAWGVAVKAVKGKTHIMLYNHKLYYEIIQYNNLAVLIGNTS